MALRITSRDEVERYFASDKVNQSHLKELIPGLNNYKKKLAEWEERERSGEIPDHFLIGSAVDTLLTGNIGDFEEEFYVLDVENKPSDTETAMIDLAYKHISLVYEEIGSLEDYPNVLEDVIKEFDWYKGNPGPKRIASFIERGKEYFEALKNSDGKKILSLSQKLTIDNVVNSLKNNERTSQFFDRDYLEDMPFVTTHYQFIAEFEYLDIDMKAMMDTVIFNYDKDSEEPLTARVVELKTMNGDTLDFLNNLRRFRYDFQVAFYNFALEKALRERGYKYTKILNPIFIVESTTNPGNPLVFETTVDLMKMGEHGRKEFYIRDKEKDSYAYFKPIKGFREMIQEYKYYLENGWETDKIILESSDRLLITWDKIR